jgi:salicylate hydroxylase
VILTLICRGIRSFIRHEILHDEGTELHLTDECLFRTMIPKSAVASDQKLLSFFDLRSVNVWAGPQKHLDMYPVRIGNLLNLVWNDHDDGEVGCWNEPADLDELRKNFALFEALFQRLLDHV